ncbi:glycoside hydrolase family 3 protein [Planoprotostelium fungivorum]|uniref:Glycoside hydrolase family 3 protein n=1 Tax=Planoprotostelium fungivorum TaxID=1890364 RepID=A0A2P6NVC6_9EUKA|nr:glycoside hydrolase family 3 protein [Planoprotostelium fungivorum]
MPFAFANLSRTLMQRKTHIALGTAALGSLYLVSLNATARAEETKKPLEAISLLKGEPGHENVKGTVNFKRLDNGRTKITAQVYGLTDGKHGFHVHQLGDLSNGCTSAGPHFNPFKKTHGGPKDNERHVGDLGNIEKLPGKEPAEYSLEDSLIQLDGEHSIIGRSVVVHTNEDDLGRGGFEDSKTTGHAGGRIACGVSVNHCKVRFSRCGRSSAGAKNNLIVSWYGIDKCSFYVHEEFVTLHLDTDSYGQYAVNRYIDYEMGGISQARLAQLLPHCSLGVVLISCFVIMATATRKRNTFVYLSTALLAGGTQLLYHSRGCVYTCEFQRDVAYPPARQTNKTPQGQESIHVRPELDPEKSTSLTTMRTPFLLAILALLISTALSIKGVSPLRSPAFRPAATGAALDDHSFTTKLAWKLAQIKAKTVVANLTQQEKIDLATGVGWMNGPCVGNTPPVSSIKFPGYCLQDSPTGVRFTDHASAFPAGINAASTWDRDLIYARSVAMGQEYKGKGVNIALTPMMNLGRVAKGGRNWEGFGADPYLTAQCAVQSILGIQSVGVMANAKHYIANEQEHFRTTSSSNLDDRTTHELYALPFLYSVRAGVGSFMCSYNLVNNTYACENPRSLNEILKQEFNFKGFVMSDWAATMSTLSVNAGLDMTMPGDVTMGSGNSYFGKNLSEAIDAGKVEKSRLDDMAVRILTPWYLLGQDKNFPETNLNSFNRSLSKHVNVAGDHHKIIRQIGAASNVLLKNKNNALPLTYAPGERNVKFGVIGSDAGPSQHGPNACTDHGCDDGTLAQGWGSGTTDFPYLITPLEAINSRAREHQLSVDHCLDDYDYVRAKDVAANSETAIVFVNSNSGEQYITFDGNEGDRNNMSLWHNGDDLINAVASVNPNTVVVIHSVGPVLMPWIDNPNVTAVVLAHLPGQESGNSLADVLFGDVNPSGRLIYTIGKSEKDYGTEIVYESTSAIPQVDYTEGLFIDYRHFDKMNIEPTFPFGFGLSYTNFKYANLRVLKNSGNFTVSDSNKAMVEATFEVTNTGPHDGHEVAQLYLAYPETANEPPKQLRGFDRVYIRAGKTVSVTLRMTPLDFAVWNTEQQQWKHESGKYTVHIGASSRDLPLSSDLNL